MIDTPESGNTADQPDPNLPDPNLLPELGKPPDPNEHKEQSKHDSKYAEYIMWPFKTVGRWFMYVVMWLDENDGAVTAVATIVIAVLTGFYVHYAKVQWKAMRDQITEMQGSGKQTDKLICLYQKQLAELQKQGTDTHTLAEAASNQIHIMSETLKLERPWVGPASGGDASRIFSDPTTKFLTRVDWRYQNGG
jgi:hypothetical protein